MSKEKAKEYEDAVAQHEDAQQWGEAAEIGTLLAYEHFGESLPSRPFVTVTSGLFALLKAATYYRINGMNDRCRNRCRMGILVAEDVRARISGEPIPENFYDHARRGAWDEYIGDFRVIGGIEGSDEAYESAKEVYESAGDPETGFAEWEHTRLLDYFRQVAKLADYDEDELGRVNTKLPLSEWVKYKQENLPKILEDIGGLG